MSEQTTTAFRLAPLARTVSTRTAEQEARARATGYTAGYAAGVREAAVTAEAERAEFARQHQTVSAAQAVEYTARLAALDAAIIAANARTAPVLAAAENAVYAAAIDLSEAILGRELTTGPGSAVDALTRALNTTPSIPVSDLRMNPRDVASLNASGATVPPNVHLVEDPTLAVGDAIAEHNTGYLDARITEALTRAKHALDGES